MTLHPSPSVFPVNESIEKSSCPDFKWSSAKNPYLNTLCNTYKLGQLFHSTDPALEKIKKVADWVHKLWEHDGWNASASSDPFSIIGRAQKGESFRCVEYSIVLAACLNALGIPARKLALKTQDAPTRVDSAGHVVVEAYLAQLGKWMMIDPQAAVLPVFEGIPLNAVEFKEQLTDRKKGLNLWNCDSKKIECQDDTEDYFQWIFPYLFYLDTPLNNSYPLDPHSKKLMFVPNEGEKITVFQCVIPLKNMFYTSSVEHFYQKPNAK